MPARDRIYIQKILFAAACLLAGTAAPSHATQAHGGMEGIIAHQAGHLFFMISMATFAYWLRERGATEQKGWRYIFYAALFFALWNLDVILVHLLDEQLMAVEVQKAGLDLIQKQLMGGKAAGTLNYIIKSDSRFLAKIYFLAKHDHLLCVPPMIFFYLGLRRLLADSEAETSGASS